MCVVLTHTPGLAQQVETTTGKTFGNEIVFETPPFFHLVSRDSVNGKPAFDYFLLVKAKLNGIYDITGGLQGFETFNVGQIDVWDSADTQRFWMDMHQSQLRFRGQRETEKGTFIGYMEGDFWGGSQRFRLRHLWVDYKFIHFGQDWSFFGDKDVWPNVFDWDGPPSGVWRRAPELKFYFGESSSVFEFGIGQPDAQVLFNNDVDETVQAADQRFPDVIGAWKRNTSFGHIRVTGIVRGLKYSSAGDQRTVPGYGATVSGYVSTSQEANNSFQFQFVGGEGIATYLASFGGYNYDAAPDGSGEIKAIPTFGGWAAYEHYFNEQWHTNLVGGFSTFQSHAIDSYTIPGPDFIAEDSEIRLRHGYGLVNLMYDPVPALVFGVEWNVGYKESVHEGTITTGEGTVGRVEASRWAQRISFGLFFDF